jgi:hypothetical protein
LVAERSGFGKCLTRLMHDRGYKRQMQLLRALEEQGFNCKSRMNLWNWLHGTHPPPEFVQAVCLLLKPDVKEEVALYHSYVWESREYLNTFIR